MRLSGNYFDRLLFNVLPWTFIISLLIHFTKSGDLKRTIIVFIISTTAFWIMDTLIIFFKFKRPKTLRLDTKLIWGDTEILPKEILRIRPIRDNRYRWSFKMIEVSLNDGTNFYLIDKPNHFVADILGRPSMTIKRLIEEYPELDKKIAVEQDI
ncbi:MAG: hypothetical protein HYZ42_15040 [Bacteroidetes bacterium]|nr:hypothetical protein [Bacteroidota bacterium]